MNLVVVKGRLGSDPDVRFLEASGKTVASCSLAIDEFPGGGKEKTTWWLKIQAWEKSARFLADYFRKGQEILVTGRLRREEWTDKEGQKQSRIYVVADRLEFCGSKKDREGAAEGGASPERAAAPPDYRSRPAAPPESAPGYEPDLDESIPF